MASLENQRKRNSYNFEIFQSYHNTYSRFHAPDSKAEASPFQKQLKREVNRWVITIRMAEVKVFFFFLVPGLVGMKLQI